MTLSNARARTNSPFHPTYIESHVNRAIDSLINSLPSPERLTADQRRGIIARYSAVLEGNFIYWMTGAYLATQSEEAREIIRGNLHEEIRDCHPGMMRRFALAANAFPTEADSLDVYRDLSNVRSFIGRLSGVPVLVMMTFFEGFIQKFMDFLAKLAVAQGSAELEYTDVHGVCDIAHTEGLFRAVAAEMALNPPEPGTNLYEGMDLLISLLHTIVPQTRKRHNLVATVGASLSA